MRYTAQQAGELRTISSQGKAGKQGVFYKLNLHCENGVWCTLSIKKTAWQRALSELTTQKKTCSEQQATQQRKAFTHHGKHKACLAIPVNPHSNLFRPQYQSLQGARRKGGVDKMPTSLESHMCPYVMLQPHLGELTDSTCHNRNEHDCWTCKTHCLF